MTRAILRLGNTFWQKCFNGLESADSLRVGSKVWSASDHHLRPSSFSSPSLTAYTDSLSLVLDTWECRHFTRGALREYTDDIKVDKFFEITAASAGGAHGRSHLASRCTVSFWPSSTSSSSFSSLFSAVVSQSPSPTGPNSLTESHRVAPTVTAEENGRKTSQLDCPKVGNTLHAEQTGSKPSQLAGQRVGGTRQAEQPGPHQHRVAEEFLNFVMASELPGAGTTGRTASADEAGRRTPWVSSASRRGTSSKPSSTTQAPWPLYRGGMAMQEASVWPVVALTRG